MSGTAAGAQRGRQSSSRHLVSWLPRAQPVIGLGHPRQLERRLPAQVQPQHEDRKGQTGNGGRTLAGHPVEDMCLSRTHGEC